MVINYQPKVSIVIPIYNGANYMREAIDSALAQTYENIEIVVVNDGSRDKGATRKIAQSYGDKIRYFEKENGGVATALNRALREMTGEYFSWLSHDDIYLPDKIEKQIKYLSEMENRDRVILYSDYELIDEKTRAYCICRKPHEELMANPALSLLDGAVNGITLLIPRTAFDECGLFREDLRCTQDYELWRRMMDKYCFVHQPEVLAGSRQHKGQDTHTSPVVVSEGNALWLDLVESFPIETKLGIGGSEYGYYARIMRTLKFTPYDKAIEYVDSRMKELEKQTEEKVHSISVSVIIPFYNRSDVIKRAIASALNQTLKPAEILLVNDGSTELGGLEQFISDKQTVRLINCEENKGPANARNIGIDEAKGEYVAFLDSDDEFVPDKLEQQVRHMLLRGSDLSYTSYIRQSENESVKIDGSNDDAAILKTTIYSCRIATPTVMIKRSVLEKTGVRYNTQIRIGEDVCFYLELMKYARPSYCDGYLSIVHVQDSSAALDDEKQIIGFKNIMAYLFNDSFYYKYSLQLGLISNDFARLVLVKHEEELPKQSKIAYLVERFNAYYYALRVKGLRHCLRKLREKIAKKLGVG